MSIVPLNTQRHPPDPDTVIWRYMDEFQFADMLITFSQHHLWCTTNLQNVNYFNDPGQLWFSYP